MYMATLYVYDQQRGQQTPLLNILPILEKTSCDRCCARDWSAEAPPRQSVSDTNKMLWRHVKALHCTAFSLKQTENWLSRALWKQISKHEEETWIK